VRNAKSAEREAKRVEKDWGIGGDGWCDTRKRLNRVKEVGVREITKKGKEMKLLPPERMGGVTITE